MYQLYCSAVSGDGECDFVAKGESREYVIEKLTEHAVGEHRYHIEDDDDKRQLISRMGAHIEEVDDEDKDNIYAKR